MKNNRESIIDLTGWNHSHGRSHRVPKHRQVNRQRWKWWVLCIGNQQPIVTGTLGRQKSSSMLKVLGKVYASGWAWWQQCIVFCWEDPKWTGFIGGCKTSQIRQAVYTCISMFGLGVTAKWTKGKCSLIIIDGAYASAFDVVYLKMCFHSTSSKLLQ